MLMWSAWCASNAKSSPEEQHLRAAVIANLSGADPEVAEFLAQADLAALLNPGETLAGLAQARGWHPHAIDAPHWLEGKVHFVDGQPRLHSVMLAAAGDAARQELQRRVWRAQIAVLFPLLEQQRLLLIDELRPMLRPEDRSYGSGVRECRSVRELELSQILGQVRGRVDHALRRRLQTLVRARNSLAHLETLDAATVRELLEASDEQTGTR
jgi:hypothetical protein